MTGNDAPVGTRRLLVELDRTVAEQADRHATTLESLLAVLRSSRLDDQAARTVAIDTAAAALVALREATEQQRRAMLEPVHDAFARLRDDLRLLTRFGDLEVQFVDPPLGGRALPLEVAHAARAIVRSAVLALVDGASARRVRIQWDCDGLNLLISVRDDGDGELSAHDDALRPIGERVHSLNGSLSVSSTRGWGTSLDVVIPLDPPSEQVRAAAEVALTERERDVLGLLASGASNRAIAARLVISSNTVKFHVSNVLRKTQTRTRAELIALAAR